MTPTRIAIEYAARVAATCETLEKGRYELVDMGIEEEFASRLLFIVPHAFGTVLYERQGIHFCPTFLEGPAGYDSERRFEEEATFPLAVALGHDWIDSENSKLFHSACDWSAQVAIARDRIARQVPLDDLSKPPRYSFLIIPWYGGPPKRPSEA